MGYSNNKWRKILTILMIINLCFILFAKITKSFGADVTTFTVETDNGDYHFPTWIKNYNYAILCGTRNNIPLSAFIILDDNISQCQLIEAGSYYIINNRPVIRFSATSFDCIISEEQATSSYKWNVGNNNACLIDKIYINNTIYYYSNFDIVDSSNNNTIFPSNSFTAPFFDNSTEIQDGNPDGVFISPGDYSKDTNLYFHLLEINTGLSNANTSLYYYSDKTFILNKDSDYYSTWVDPSIDGFYYYIPRYKLGLSQNTSYLYVLNNSKEQIQNSNGLIEKDVSNGIYDAVQSDTAGVITATEEETDRMKNIEAGIYQNQETTNNINDSLTNTTVTEETETDINGSLNFNNQNEGLNNLNGGFFSRLTTMLSNLLGYNLAEDTSVSLPLPNSNKSLTLHSIDIYNNVNGTLRLIINAFWVYIFTFYMWKFINKIYIAISTGNILDSFSSSGEAITNDML